ncbi:phenazine biosynthesis protein PhzF family protein, partial [Paraphysoderma sedebokerense]
QYSLQNQDYYIVDAFTSARFTGNPAAVIILPDAFPDDSILLKVAREFNLSETAFLRGLASPSTDEIHYHLRWFTPTTEIELCGHATLASAHILYNHLNIPSNKSIHFTTLSGILICTKKGEKVQMSFPDERPKEVSPGAQDEDTKIARLETVLGIKGGISYVGRNRFDIVVEVDGSVDVATVKPDLAEMAKLKTRAVVITTKSANPSYDIISRVFAPAAGVPEDPVTGSAHCLLAPYWCQKFGKSTLTAFQAYPDRGGVLYLRWIDDGRVYLEGESITVMKGVLL